MRDINELSEDEQIEYIESDVFYFVNCIWTSFKEELDTFPRYIDNFIIVENYYVSLIPQSPIIFDFSYKKPFFFIKHIKNPSERIQLEVIKNIDYNNISNDGLVKIYIKSEKAKELYKKLKKAHDIIK